MLWFSEVLRLLTASTLHNNAIKVSLDFNNVTVYQQVLAIVSKPADMPDQYIPGTFLVYKLHRPPGTNLFSGLNNLVSIIIFAPVQTQTLAMYLRAWSHEDSKYSTHKVQRTS